MAAASGGGSISGRVTDPGGAGVENVWVYADASNGGGSTFTAADGTYTIGGLPTGSYKVFFDGSNDGYAPEYYDGKTDWDSADRVSVTIGQQTSGINAQLGATNTYSIGGTVSRLASGQSVVLQNNGTDNKTVSTNGAFTFDTDIAAGGSYAVTVLTQPSGQTCTVSNGNGSNVMADVTSVAVACTDNGGPPSENRSSISSQNDVVTSGDSTTIIVTVRDANSNPLSGISVSLVVDSASVNAGAVSINTSPTPTNAQGEARFEVSSTIAQEVTFKASFNPELFITVRWRNGAGAPVSVPTMSAYGLATLSGLMGLLGWRFTRRRS